MGKYSIFGALLFSVSLPVLGAPLIPFTQRTTNRITIETQIVDVDLYVYGDIAMTQSGYFDMPPKNSFRHDSISSLDQMICEQLSPSLLAVNSKREAVQYSTLIGKSILYSRDYVSLDPREWKKEIRPFVSTLIVPEDPDVFFADMKNTMLNYWSLPVHFKNLNEARNHLVLGHITSVSCQRTVAQ